MDIHSAETNTNLTYEEIKLLNIEELDFGKLNEVNILFLSIPYNVNHRKCLNFFSKISNVIKEDCKVVLFANNDLLPLLVFGLEQRSMLNYKMWITVRHELQIDNNSLPKETKGLVIFSKNKKPINICKVRIPYSFCPACNKTTKDYGGKKHLFHEYGTLMSDVWKDLVMNSKDPLPPYIIKRIKDMFSLEPNKKMLAISLWNYQWQNEEDVAIELPFVKTNSNKKNTNIYKESVLILGDALVELKQIKDASVDFVFVDPPYNLKKKYSNYTDDLDIEDYFSWCDEWLNECVRVLKPGKYLSILNLPLWSVRHYAFLIQMMELSSWITWEALSRPARNIMPANYTILTMKKPGDSYSHINTALESSLLPTADYYCLRESCIKTRDEQYKPLSDLWTDIHRLKHNSRRYDHPCQLPPKLMQRLISIYSNPGDFVLDCFNGVGTTTLSADLLNRKYIGIELIEKYHNTTLQRHRDIIKGLSPFRKNKISPKQKIKNNEEKRVCSPNPQKSGYTKKQVQLMIKELSKELNRIPTIDDAIKHLDVPREFYDTFFRNWSEVVAATKTTGMIEYKILN